MITAMFKRNAESGIPRTKEVLKIHYKNMKAKAKKEAATTRINMKATGGGLSFMNFGLFEVDIIGIANPFDSNRVPITQPLPNGYVVKTNLHSIIKPNFNVFQRPEDDEIVEETELEIIEEFIENKEALEKKP